jgi:hypothetical protein
MTGVGYRTFIHCAALAREGRGVDDPFEGFITPKPEKKSSPSGLAAGTAVARGSLL